MRRLLLGLALLLGSIFSVAAQEGESNGFIVDLIQDSLSAPNRQIRLIGIDGLLNSDARVDEITVSDEDGTWLAFRDVELVWTRTALFSKRLKIDSLRAGEIELIRKPLPGPAALPSPEAQGFSLPELPVSVEIGSLELPKIALGEEFLGQDAVLALTGALTLADGALDTSIRLERTDIAGTNFALDASFENDTRVLKVDLAFKEDKGGLLTETLEMAGRPALDLSVQGEGPLEDLDLVLAMAADGEDVLNGTLRLRQAQGGLGFTADMSGAIEPLIAPVYRPFFAGESRVQARGQTRDAGGFVVETAKIETAALSLLGGLETGPDGFLRRAAFKGSLGQEGTQTILPFGAGTASIGLTELDIDFGNDPKGLWKAEMTGADLIAGDVRSGDFVLRFAGVAENLDTPEARSLTINADGRLAELRGATRDLSRALGREIGIKLASNWRPGLYTIDKLAVTGNALTAQVGGEIEEFSFAGDVALKVERLAPFGGFAGRDLQGALDLNLNGIISPITGSFDLAMRGVSEALKLDVPSLDPLLIGTTRLSGQLLRNETGFRTRGFRLANDQMRITSDGVIASERADLTFEAVLNDLADLTARATGKVTLSGSAKGDDGKIAVRTAIAAPSATLLDQELRGFDAGFEGVLEAGALTGAFSGTGSLGPDPISLTADLSMDAESQSLSDLLFRIGATRIVGELDRRADGLLNGGVRLNAPDISVLASLALQEASGRANLSIGLTPNAFGQKLVTNGSLEDIVFGGSMIGKATLDAVVENAFGVPTIAGSLDFADAVAGGIEIDEGHLTAGGVGTRTDIGLDTDLANGTRLRASGALNATETGFDVTVSRFNLSADEPLVSLARPGRVTVADGQIEIETFDLTLGDGGIQAEGWIGENFDLSLTLDDVPLSTANAFREDLGVTGTLSGTAAVIGLRDAPDFRFDLTGKGLSAKALEDAELPPLDVTAQGETQGEDVAVTANLSGPGNFDADITGTVGLSDLEMELEGRLNRLPLALIDPVAGRQGMRGSVSGRFGLFETPTKPRVNFNLTAQDMSVTASRENGMAPLRLTTSGSFVNDVITLPEAQLTDGNGLTLNITGRIPLRLDGLNVSAEGRIPLTVASVAFARSGISATGTTDVRLRATGSIARPDLTGALTLRDGTFVSSQANVRLEAVNIDAGFAGDRLQISSATATNSRGGSLSATGAIVIDARRGFPVEGSVSVNDLRYTDGKLATAEAAGSLSLSGALLRRSRLSGDINLRTLEFSIPDTAGARQQYRLDVQHVNASPAVRRTLERAGLTEAAAAEARSDSIMDFDITVNAPNRVFVRGRGVDAELGGTLKVGGTSRNVRPVGKLDLIRGRINVLAQRIELTSGTIRFTGTTIPEIEMLARTVTDDVEANVSLEGLATKPVLAFSSVPDLPDDEVLARLVFDRPLSELSPLQVAQLAAAAGELSGRTGPSFFSQLRDATGLDDLDFETETDGRTTVRVGKYIQDNVYSTIEADNRGSSRATINLDINRNFTAKGTLDNEGNTSFGIFFEKDY